MNKLKKITTILAAASLVFTLASCGDKITDGPTDTSDSSVVDINSVAESVVDEVSSEVESVSAELDLSEESTEDETTVETTTEEETETTTEKTTEKKTEAATKAEVKAPTEKAEILKIYNDASAKLISAKPGYSKAVTTTVNSLEMGALSKLSIVRQTIGDFLGEGVKSYSNAKGGNPADTYAKSALTEADVTNATCTLSSDKKAYDITLTIKNETNPLHGQSALGRFTHTDDYKDHQQIVDGLAEAGVEVSSVTMTTTSVVIKATISVEDSSFKSLNYTFSQNVVFTNVKYSIVKVAQATGTMTSKVDYTGFAY